jgi:hypothetical protein
MNKTNRTIAALSCLTLSAVAASGQSTPGAPEFEVATVETSSARWRTADVSTHPCGGDEAFSGGPGSKDPGRIDYSRVTLKMLLARAYNLKPDQIQGPDWTGPSGTPSPRNCRRDGHGSPAIDAAESLTERCQDHPSS